MSVGCRPTITLTPSRELQLAKNYHYVFFFLFFFVEEVLHTASSHVKTFFEEDRHLTLLEDDHAVNPDNAPRMSIGLACHPQIINYGAVCCHVRNITWHNHVDKLTSCSRLWAHQLQYNCCL